MKHFFLLFIISIIILSSCWRNRDVSDNTISNEFYKKALDYRETANPDSAFLYFNKAKDLFLHNRDSLGAGKCLVNMAIISTDKGDYFGGQELSLNALPFFDGKKEDQFVYIKSNLNNLGIASSKLELHQQAINFYQQSLKYTLDSSAILVIKNNIANVYRRQRDYQKALIIYRDILKHKLNHKDLARVLSNFAYTKWLRNKTYNPTRELWKALRIRQKGNDLLGQNASYSHFVNYYTQINRDSAFYYAGQMYLVARLVNSPDDKLDALEKLISLGPASGTKQYFAIYHQLKDSLQSARNAAKNQFALIRYDSEKNKADNLRLQKENNEKKYQILSLAGLVLFVIIIFVSYRRKKKNAVRDSQLKTSKKVHDVVANGLYRIMTELENLRHVNKDGLLDKIEELYEQSRDISYDKPSVTKNEFHEKLASLLTSFANAETKVNVVKNNAGIWMSVNAEARYEVLHILQEIMVNMRKHSRAHNVVIKFEEENKHIHIRYTDDGTGLPRKLTYGNGLTNTGTRIEKLQGTIIFGNNTGIGTRIDIAFPVA